MKKIKLPHWKVAMLDYDLINEEDTVETIDRLKEITGIESPYGIVYLVSFSDNTYYIGKKSLYSELNVKKGKRELEAMTDKRGSKKKKVVKESNWKSYYGSFKDKEFISKIEFGEVTVESRYIIAVATSKAELTYLETKFLFIHNVLKRPDYRNDNILGKFYRSKIQ